MSIIGGVIATVGGKILDKAMDSGDDSDLSSKTQGVSSAVNSSNPSVPGAEMPASVSGDLSGELIKSSVNSMFDKGMNSVLNPQMNAREQGMANREYLQASMPNMNEWERAGATATQAGVAQGNQQLQSKMQDKQLATQYEIAKMNNATSRSNNAVNAYASNQKLPYEISNLRGAKSSLGKIFDDFSNVSGDVLSGSHSSNRSAGSAVQFGSRVVDKFKSAITPRSSPRPARFMNPTIGSGNYRFGARSSKSPPKSSISDKRQTDDDVILQRYLDSQRR